MAFLIKSGMLVLLRNQLHLDDVTLSMSSPGGITWSVGMMSLLGTARLTELDSKTGYYTLTSLEMSGDLFIHHVDS